MGQPINDTGKWSSLLAAVFAIGYSVPQLLSVAGLIPFPTDLVWFFVPSLLLAPSFLIAMICLHYKTAPDKKIWTAIAVAFAIVYCCIASSIYFAQLSVVVPGMFAGTVNETHVFYFNGKTVMVAVDTLGYAFMSVSTLFAAFAVRDQVKQRWLYRWLFSNGLLAPVIIVAFFFPALIYGGALWMITFPAAMIKLFQLFKNQHSENGLY
jgi:hypothetical protein